MRVERIAMNSPERCDELRSYSYWLLQVGEGKAPTVAQNIIQIPAHMVGHSEGALKQSVYNNFQENLNNRAYRSKRAIMAGTNKT
eukprot:14084899-Ditylum_brightwellii.AAC.1